MQRIKIKLTNSRAMTNLLFCVLILSPSFSFGDVIVTDPKQEVAKHIEPDENPDTSPSSPPLETDDPGTPGPWGIEVNVPFHYDSDRNGFIRSTGIDANLGIGERGQIRVEQNYFEQRQSGSRVLRGTDQTAIGFKYRFYDVKSFQMALYPSYDLSDETRQVNVDGTKLDSAGAECYLPLILLQQIGKTSLVENIGYASNVDYTNRYLFFTSIALGFPITNSTRIMSEVASTKTGEGRRTNLRVGLVHEIAASEQSKLETALFLSYGHSITATDDHLNHSLALFGFTVARKADAQK